ncbi:MAG: oligosaccharide flippase family protein, partial [Panacibacter sp.]
MIQQFRKIRHRFSKDKNINEFAKQSAYSFGMRVFGLLVNYLFLFFVTRYFGAKGWGVFAICFALLQIGSMIGTLGINVGLVKIVPQGYTNLKQLYNQVLRVIIPLNIVITIFVFFAADFISSFLDADGVSVGLYIKISALGILPFSISMINSGLFRGNKEIILFSFYDSLGRFLFGGIVVFILHFFSSDIAIIMGGFVVGLYLLAILSFMGIHKILKKRGESDIVEHKPYAFSELMKLSNSLFWTTFIYQGALWATTLILGAYLSKEEVGIFDATNRFASLLTIIGYAI